MGHVSQSPMLLDVTAKLANSSLVYQITSPFSLTFFAAKESYKESASLSKKDYYLLPSLNSFFKGDGFPNDSFSKGEMENVMIAFAIINILLRTYPLAGNYHLRFALFEAG